MKNKILAWVINLLFIGFLFWKITKTANHKEAAAMFLFYYPVLIFLDLAIWLAFRLFGNNNYKAFRQTGIGLLLLAIPLYMVAGRL